MNKITHILVPTDFGAAAAHATEYAMELADKFDARLTLLHVCDVPLLTYSTLLYVPTDLLGTLQTAAEKELDVALEKAKQRFPRTQSSLECGVPVDVILDTIQSSGADLVVMGTHGRRGLSHAVLGSVAERTVRRAPVPVLVVHGSAPADAADRSAGAPA